MMGNVNRKPPRSAPQLLVIAERDRVEAALRASCTGPLDLTALELERNQTLQFGEVNELVVFARSPEGKGIVVRHVMPGGEVTTRDLVGAAEVLGQAISARFRRFGGMWVAPVLSDDPW